MIRLAIILALWAGPTLAAPHCAPSIMMLMQINRFSEVIHEQKDRPESDGSIVTWILWTNEETGSWTLTGTRKNVTCAIAGAKSGYAGQSIDDLLMGAAI